MKFFELENEALLDSLADTIEPMETIFTTPKVAKLWKEKKRAKAIVIILREFKKETIQILAALNGTPINEFKCDFLSLANGVKEILDNKEIMVFFTSLIQTLHSFGSVMENLEETETE